MTQEKIKKLIRDIKEGRLTSAQAEERLKILPYQDIGFAKIDHHRSIRKGFPEVVYGKGKTAGQILSIAGKLYDLNGIALVTRISAEKYGKIKDDLPLHEYNEQGLLLRLGRRRRIKKIPAVPVVTAGTADIPVAEEAAGTLEAMGIGAERIYDTGAAGVHRILHQMGKFKNSRVIIVIAGMDGILPTVVGGLVRQPVIAVPTSTGYGASFSGIGPLLTMLNSCAPGVVTVNIDNGFGAAYAAALINGI
ncbi:MAG: nickel pincer cofactor biosynthesis protein LarB [Elusimicrobiota bacterium]